MLKMQEFVSARKKFSASWCPPEMDTLFHAPRDGDAMDDNSRLMDFDDDDDNDSDEDAIFFLCFF